MKLTRQTVTQEVKTTETVCEITQDEFDSICAKTAADIVTQFIGDDAGLDDLKAGLELTSLLAKFVMQLDVALFHCKPENPDKNEKEEN